MGMESPDNRCKADDSCQALSVGRSVPKTPPRKATGLIACTVPQGPLHVEDALRVRPAPCVCYLRSWAGTEGRRRMSGLISVALGSVLGAIARYFISGFVARRVGETFPWGTLFINVSGAFLIGTFGRLAESSASILASPDPWLFAVTG